jgi:1,3-beta-glucan synthase
MLMMLLFATLTVWTAALIYFWLSLFALIISPFLYNPHQFSWNDFFIDYRDFLRWLSRGNSRSHASSWISYCRLSRTRITGYKRKAAGDPSGKLSADVPRAAITNLFFGEILAPLFLAIVTLIPYLFINAQTGVNGPNKKNNPSAKATASLLRVAIVAFAPIAINAGALLVFFFMACFMGPLLSMCCKKFGSVLAAIAHGIAVIVALVFFEVMFLLEGFDFTKTLLGMIAVIAVQRFIFKLIISLTLTREFRSDQANIAFWTGKWYSMGWHSVSQPAREFLCKITELSMFAGDFLLGHFILFLMLPVILIPQIDKLHSIMLFWLRPSRQIRPPIYSMKQSKLRRRRVIRYAILYFVMLVVCVGLVVGPVVAGKNIPSSLLSPLKGTDLVQPTGLNNDDTMSRTPTGTGSIGYTGEGTASGSDVLATATVSSEAARMLF